jgi:hypothetical protein
MELVGFASGNFTNGYLAGFGTNFIQTNGAPTSLRDKKFTVTGWITGRGADTPAQSITLIATVNYDTVVAAATNPTDAEKFALATQRYVAPVANPTLTSDLTLPTTYTVPGTTIVANLTWTSSNPSVISNSGVVTRPAFGQPDVNVTLSYVMSLGAQANAAVEIAYTVKAVDTDPSVVVTAAYPTGTTTNMTSENNAASIGLNATLFTVTSTQREQNPLHVGLNSAGQIRMYGSANTNGNVLTIAIASGYVITNVEIVFCGSGSAATGTIQFGSATPNAITSVLNTTATYGSLDATSFAIKNTSTSTAQIYILSIKITYIPQA